MSSIAPRTATVTVYTGDYLDRIRHLEQRARAAEEAANNGPAVTLDESPEYLDIAREHDELVAEAEESAVHIVVQALPRGEWKKLVSEHPPRTEGGERIVAGDAALGVNEDTFKDALVPASVTSHDRADVDALSDIDFDRVYFAAFNLNRGTVSDPKASLVSRLTKVSDET